MVSLNFDNCALEDAIWLCTYGGTNEVSDMIPKRRRGIRPATRLPSNIY